MSIILAVVGIMVLAWLLARLFPALLAACLVVLAPLWLLGGLVLDLVRWPLAWLRRVDPDRLGRRIGAVLIFPLTPFIYAWAYLVALLRRPRPADPMHAAARRTAEIIDLAAFRRQKSASKE